MAQDPGELEHQVPDLEDEPLDPLDLGLGVMRERDRWVDIPLLAYSRDPALQVLPHDRAFVQR